MNSATQVNTIPVDQNPSFLPFDYNLLARKIIASEEFQHLLMNQLNISQSELMKIQNQEFQQFFGNQLQEMNSENFNWVKVIQFYVNPFKNVCFVCCMSKFTFYKLGNL